MGTPIDRTETNAYVIQNEDEADGYGRLAEGLAERPGVQEVAKIPDEDGDGAAGELTKGELLRLRRLLRLILGHIAGGVARLEVGLPSPLLGWQSYRRADVEAG